MASGNAIGWRLLPWIGSSTSRDQCFESLFEDLEALRSVARRLHVSGNSVSGFTFWQTAGIIAGRLQHAFQSLPGATSDGIRIPVIGAAAQCGRYAWIGFGQGMNVPKEPGFQLFDGYMVDHLHCLG